MLGARHVHGQSLVAGPVLRIMLRVSGSSTEGKRFRIYHGRWVSGDTMPEKYSIGPDPIPSRAVADVTEHE